MTNSPFSAGCFKIPHDTPLLRLLPTIAKTHSYNKKSVLSTLYLHYLPIISCNSGHIMQFSRCDWGWYFSKYKPS